VYSPNSKKVVEKRKLSIKTVLADSMANRNALNIKIEFIKRKSANLINTGYPPWVNFKEFLGISRLVIH